MRLDRPGEKSNQFCAKATAKPGARFPHIAGANWSKGGTVKIEEFLRRFPDAKTSGDGWQAKCPAHEDHTPSLSIREGEDGRVLVHCHAGCTPEAICAKLGITPADLFQKNGHSKRITRAKSETAFDWLTCLAAFTDADAQKLTEWRSISPDFFKWLHSQGAIGLHEGNPAFANHGDAGKVVSCHVRLESGNWIFKPKGQRTGPLVFGDVKAAGYVLTFESQWDAFAVMDKLGWHVGEGLPDSAVLITRGASNGKLVKNRLSPDAVCYAFAQNDAPGEKWLADLAVNCACKVLSVATPAPHKDCNDWTRAGATKAEIEAAMHAARPANTPGPTEIKTTAPSFEAITSDVRGQIVHVLTDANCKGTARNREIAKLVAVALAKVGKLYFHAERRDFDSAMFFDSAAKQLWRIRSDAFLSWFSEWLGINRADPLFKYACAEVETAALSNAGATAILPESYWAARPGGIYISNGDGQAVKITANAVQLVDNGTDGVLFAAGRTLQPWQLTKAQDVFETCAIFQNARCAAGHALDLIRVWIYSLVTNPRSKPPLCLAGDIGSGKTRLAKAIAELFGVPFVAAKVEESEESNFWPSLDAGGLFTLDNADTRCRWLADAIANAATDGCSQRRKLYTNSETVTLRARAWLCVTTANPTFAADAGLADRLLLVRMARRDGEATSDEALTDEIRANRDAGLSHVAATLRTALADTAPTPTGLNARHPDFAAFAVRIGRALGREAEAVAALRQAEADKSAFCLENDSIGAALLAYLRTVQTFTGTAAELVPKLIEVDSDLAERLSAKRLGRRLAAIWPHLQSTLATAKREQDRRAVTIFTFKAATSAGFAGFQTPFPLKSY